MTSMLPSGVDPRELAALVGGVREVLLSPRYQQILRSYPAEVLDSPGRTVNPLPSPPMLEGTDDSGIFAQLAALIDRYGYRVETVDAPDVDPDANGATWHGGRIVQINRRRSPLQQAKTLARELIHVVLHGPGVGLVPPGRVPELQAETGAWVLLRRLGVDSGSFSFAFIAKYGAVRQGARLQPRRALVHALGDVSLLARWAIAAMPAAEAVA